MMLSICIVEARLTVRSGCWGDISRDTADGAASVLMGEYTDGTCTTISSSTTTMVVCASVRGSSILGLLLLMETRLLIADLAGQFWSALLLLLRSIGMTLFASALTILTIGIGRLLMVAIVGSIRILRSALITSEGRRTIVVRSRMNVGEVDFSRGMIAVADVKSLEGVGQGVGVSIVVRDSSNGSGDSNGIRGVLDACFLAGLGVCGSIRRRFGGVGAIRLLYGGVWSGASRIFEGACRSSLVAVSENDDLFIVSFDGRGSGRRRMHALGRVVGWG